MSPGYLANEFLKAWTIAVPLPLSSAAFISSVDMASSVRTVGTVSVGAAGSAIGATSALFSLASFSSSILSRRLDSSAPSIRL